MTLWVKNRLAGRRLARLLYPQKLSRQSFAAAAVTGQNPPHALAAKKPAFSPSDHSEVGHRPAE
jgi:hypothetical protein